ncbi:hypothetical protein [Candidatus Poriferisodalis sp.]|uniref:hypothetical protein n=1 Tax=Candidatus Poriferisodalis sp. TaxID=3101277 RepID=UPI003C7028BE
MDQPADQASIDESDEYWDEVADGFEQFDWLNSADEPAHELYLSLAVQAEAAIAEPTEVSRQQIEDAVCWARREGMQWDRIAEILGVTALAARARYGEASKAVRA